MNADTPNSIYPIERLNKNNLANVEQLYHAVYKRIPSRGFFLNKYDTGFTKVRWLGFIAYDQQNKAIAYYGVIPCFIKLENRVILAAQSADSMTHPQYRYKGLFTELALRTFKLCRENDIRLLFGFPNQNSLPGFINKLGWQMTERMDCFIIPTGTFNWGRVPGKFFILKSMLSTYQQMRLKKYLVSNREIINYVIDNGSGGIFRDQNYLRYKTYTGNQFIKIGHSTLWIKIGRNLLIGDIMVPPADFNGLMYELKSLARKLGIDKLQFHSSPGTTLHSLFSEHFKAIPSFPVIFLDFEGSLPIHKIKFTTADIDTF